MGLRRLTGGCGGMAPAAEVPLDAPGSFDSVRSLRMTGLFEDAPLGSGLRLVAREMVVFSGPPDLR